MIHPDARVEGDLGCAFFVVLVSDCFLDISARFDVADQHLQVIQIVSEEPPVSIEGQREGFGGHWKGAQISFSGRRRGIDFQNKEWRLDHASRHIQTYWKDSTDQIGDEFFFIWFSHQQCSFPPKIHPCHELRLHNSGNNMSEYMNEKTTNTAVNLQTKHPAKNCAGADSWKHTKKVVV